MQRICWVKLVSAVAACAIILPAAHRAESLTTPRADRSISRAELEDRIRGGWAGQMIGVSYGAPTEFRSNGAIIQGNLANYQDWNDDRIKNTLKQDDLYVEMTFAEVMDRIGLEATTEQYGEAFRDSKYMLWHANAAARKLLNQGIKAPWSGHPKYNSHANDIDFQIESDFIGLMCPGLPREAMKYADRVGRVMNYGDGLYGGTFFGTMYSVAFFEKDPRKVVEAGLASLPKGSGYHAVISDLLEWSAQHPDDWPKTWQLIQDKYDRDDPCPDGALSSFNIDARLNGAYVAMGLLYGKGDFDKTLEVSTRCGQDSDCNPSSAAGILGVMLGYSRIPEKWKSGIPAIANSKFAFTNYSFNDIVKSTMDRALKVVGAAGGSMTADEVHVPVQSPKAPKLEQWKVDAPREIVRVDSPAWTWSDKWSAKDDGRFASISGAGATFAFEGTGVLFRGRNSPTGGRADVWLDGKPAGTIDCYIPPDTYDDAVWHVTGLKPGRHTVRFVTRGNGAPKSKGAEVSITSGLVYGAK